MSPEGISAIVLGVAALLTAILGYRKRADAQREAAQAARDAQEAKDLAAKEQISSDNLALLRTAIEAYGLNVGNLQQQLTEARAEANADRDRHSREMAAVHLALSRCESERVDQGREIATLAAERSEQRREIDALSAKIAELEKS